MSRIIGIDLGTTMSAMATIDEVGRPMLVRNAQGNTLTPSVILFRENERVVGDRAKNAAVALPDRVVQFIKRSMDDMEYVWLDPNGNQHTIEELSALILCKLKNDAKQTLGQEIEKAVITVPAYFGDLERNRTKNAGQLAGFEVLDIINEPTAAAIAYGLHDKNKDKTILVYDLGGGTFDVTIMKIATNRDLNVITSDGKKTLGGWDFDEALCQELAKRFEAEHGFDPLDDLRSYQDFRDRSEQAKIDLSDDTEVYVSLSSKGKSLDTKVTREDFERLISHLVDETKTITESVMRDAKMDWANIDDILLVGGSTRVPAVRQMVESLAGKPAKEGINPDEVVAMGAAVYAANLDQVPVRDERGQSLPPVLICNVTAHQLGIISYTDANTPRNAGLIMKDNPIPAEGSDMFTTLQDNQTEVRLQIIEGEDEDPEECVKVGEAAVLSGIPPQPKGQPQIQVTLKYDRSAIVHLHAKELGSSVELSTDIEYKGLMSREEVNRKAQEIARLNVK